MGEDAGKLETHTRLVGSSHAAATAENGRAAVKQSFSP